MSRATEKRGGLSGGFSRGSRSAALAGRGSDVDLRTANRILRSGDEVAARVRAHHDKHREAWTNQRYDELLKKSGSAPDFKPRGETTDPRVTLENKAASGVAQSFAQRLGRVEAARDSMLQTGAVRHSRQVDWGKGLGE